MSFDVICFDCDSTLSRIEGIDELARRVGMGEEMSKLTGGFNLPGIFSNILGG